VMLVSATAFECFGFYDCIITRCNNPYLLQLVVWC
jgi:hypothetical protein